jgi:hypothetical protein
MNDSATDPLQIDLALNDVYAWKPAAPVLMTYCTADEQVDYQNTLFTYNYFLSEGDTSAHDTDGGNLNHEGCLLPALKNMVAFFSKYHIVENNLVLNLSGDSATSPGTQNASVAVSVTGGTDYNILWSTGSTDSAVTGLSDGTYTVTVTDSSGCPQVRSISIPVVSGINPLGQSKPDIQIFPNPASGFLNLKATGFTPETISVYDVNGRRVSGGLFTPRLDVSTLAQGVYMAEIKGHGIIARARFVKMQVTGF